MNVYLLVHRAPVNYTGTTATAAAWKAWFEELGPNLVDPGNAVFDRTAVGTTGSALPLGGYTIVTTESVDAPDQPRAHSSPLSGKIGTGLTS